MERRTIWVSVASLTFPRSRLLINRTDNQMRCSIAAETFAVFLEVAVRRVLRREADVDRDLPVKPVGALRLPLQATNLFADEARVPFHQMLS